MDPLIMDGDGIVVMATIAGTLHVVRVAKQRNLGTSIAALLARIVENHLATAGKVEIPEYAPMYYITTGEKCGKRGTMNYMYQFKGRPKAFTKEMDGWSVIVRCTLEPFGNGLGAYVKRYTIVDVKEPGAAA